MKHLSSVAMVELDGDDIRISSRGKLAERDIVQVRCLILGLTLSHHGKDAAHFPELQCLQDIVFAPLAEIICKW